jgi:hypothetical protein
VTERATRSGDRTVLGFRVAFLWGVVVGVLLAGAVLVWSGVVSRTFADPCERAAPTFVAAGPDRGGAVGYAER